MIVSAGTAAAAPHSYVTIISAIPSVDFFGHLDHPAVEVKSSESCDAALIDIGFNSNLHGVLAIGATQSFASNQSTSLHTTATRDHRMSRLSAMRAMS